MLRSLRLPRRCRWPGHDGGHDEARPLRRDAIPIDQLTGELPDALAGVPAAGLDRAPLLLVEPGCMPTATRQEIDRLQPSTIVVLGGPATVSDAAVSGASCAPPPPTEPTPPPAQPADRDCPDFATQAEAQAFYDFYFPYYGDFAPLDGNDDGIACNNLP